MTVVDLTDEQAAALKGIAAAEGMTLEAWLKMLAEEESAENGPLQTAAYLSRTDAQRAS